MSKSIIQSAVLICLADAVFGMTYGSVSSSYGFSPWVPVTLSILVMAGASEFLFITILASGGGVATGVLAGLLVNARHFPFGMAVRDLLANSRWKFPGCHVMNDEAVMMGLAQETEEIKRFAYWVTGIGIALSWPLSVWLGSVLGRFIPDPKAMGMDAVFPVLMFALTYPALKKRLTRIPAIVGAGIALITVWFVPTGVPVLLALLGLIVRKVIR